MDLPTAISIAQQFLTNTPTTDAGRYLLALALATLKAEVTKQNLTVGM